MPNCPHCGEPYDASARATGDRVWHPPCGQWFLVVHIAHAATELRKCHPPVSWPAKTKTKKEGTEPC